MERILCGIKLDPSAAVLLPLFMKGKKEKVLTSEAEPKKEKGVFFFFFPFFLWETKKKKPLARSLKTHAVASDGLHEETGWTAGYCGVFLTAAAWTMRRA